MKKVIIDSRAPKKVKASLLSLGFELIEMPPHPALPAPVSAHPDMLLFILSNTVFCHADHYELAKKEFDEISSEGYEIVKTNEFIGSEYPRDILFNALTLGEHIYGKLESVSSLIKSEAEKRNISLHSVKQGYAKCSVCKVGERAAITSDPSLYKAMTNDGYDVLLIGAGHIDITEYDTGFIGGCSGFDNERVYFSGNIDLHPDGKAIKLFCEEHGMSVVSLSDEPLFDIGSMFFI